MVVRGGYVSNQTREGEDGRNGVVCLENKGKKTDPGSLQGVLRIQRETPWCSGEGRALRLSDTDPSFHAFDGEEEEGAALRHPQEVSNRRGECDPESFTNLCFS